MRFVVDSMLGRLSKWLRALGYDTHYQPYYRPDAIDAFLIKGSILLTRHQRRAELAAHAVLLHGNRVGEQLIELKNELHLEPDRSVWFHRCLRCNAVLKRASRLEARENIPEYVFYQNLSEIRFCPMCGRFYWKGSHRLRMERQLIEWGFHIDRQRPSAVRET